DPSCAPQMAALARSKVGRCARDASQAAVQLHGAMGVSEELIVASPFRKLLGFHQQHGTTAAFTAAYGQHMLDTGNWRNSRVLPVQQQYGDDSMKLTLTPEQQAVRGEVRAFLRDNLTDDLRQGQRFTSGVYPEPEISAPWQ